MRRVVADCLPRTDAGFGERVRHVIGQDRWDLASAEGVALMEAVLRQTYAMATVVARDGIWAGGVRRTVLLDVYRDGAPGTAEVELRWIKAVYDRSGPAAYRTAARILGEGAAAELIVERAFRELRPFDRVLDGASVASGCAAVEAAAQRLATEARVDGEALPPEPATIERPARPTLADLSLRKGAVRRSLGGGVLASLLSTQREVLELSVIEDLSVTAIADRIQAKPAVVHRHLRDALLAVQAGGRPSPSLTLAAWRHLEREWARLPASDPARPERSRAVAHAWLDFQVASGAISPETVVLVTDSRRRFVTASANAAPLVGRPSVVGLQIDDITAEHAQPLVPELWTMFDASGSMAGDYDCDRPGNTPVRVSFRGVWGRPLPDLQVGYLQQPLSSRLS